MAESTEGKSAVSSKTLILNIVTILGAVAAALTPYADVLGEKGMAIVMGVIAVCNIVLRVFTDLPITGVFKAK
jgi:hypothetical protein